jgi:hypothetical protein
LEDSYFSTGGDGYPLLRREGLDVDPETVFEVVSY